MKLLLILYFLVAVGVECTFLHETKKDNNSFLINNAVIDILKSCSGNGLHTVGLIAPSDDLVSAMSSEIEFFTDTLIISNVSEIIDNQTSTKFQHIILSASEIINNPYCLDALKNWLTNDVNTVQLIITEYTPIVGTYNSYNQYSYHIGNHFHGRKIYNVIIVYNHYEIGNVIVLAINRYNTKAAEPWKIMEPLTSPYAMFKRNFATKSTCKSLFFEKTSTIEYHNIEMSVKSVPQLMTFNIDEALIVKPKAKNEKERFTRIQVSPDKWNIFKGFDGMVIGTLFSFLNCTATIRTYTNPVTHTYDQFIQDTLEQDFSDDRPMIGLNSHDIFFGVRKVWLTYPFLQREVAIITGDFRNVHKPVRIFGFFNIKTVISIVIVCLLLLHVLGWLSGQGFGPATLNTLRVLLGIRVQSVPTGLPFRIFLGSLLPYFFILIANFQGYLFYIQTVGRTETNIDSLDDLQACGGCNIYTSYGFKRYLEFFQNGSYHFKKNNAEHCTEMVLIDPQAVCIDDSSHLKHAVVKNHRLHLMKQPLTTIFRAYPTSIDIFLLNRINILLSRFKESGFFDIWYEQSFAFNTSITQNEPTSTEFKGITLNEYASVFFILLAGLTISTVVFVIELLVVHIRKICYIKNSNETDLFRGCH